MARKFLRTEVLNGAVPITARLGAQSAPYKDTEIGKFVKPSGESGHVLCALGDLIDGHIVGVEAATSDGFGIGTVQRQDQKFAIADGSQAAGTGVLAIGDFVVAGTVVAKDTGLGNTFAKVRKATIQPGITVPADATAAGVQINASMFAWRVVSLGPVGTGAVGTTVLIERVGGY